MSDSISSESILSVQSDNFHLILYRGNVFQEPKKKKIKVFQIKVCILFRIILEEISGAPEMS